MSRALHVNSKTWWQEDTFETCLRCAHKGGIWSKRDASSEDYVRHVCMVCEKGFTEGWRIELILDDNEEVNQTLQQIGDFIVHKLKKD